MIPGRSENVGKCVKPIAIVGLSCRFPKAHNLQEFWNMLEKGIDAVEKIPISRWDIEEYYDPDKSVPDKTHQRHAAMLEDLDKFDPFFFNISPAEAAEMTPSQKLMMELTWECIENSNIPYNQLAGQKIGVYVGNIWSDFEHLRKHKNAEVSSHSAMGQSANIIANRISYFFGFKGPSLVVDTGCSSSLVALHLSCQALWDNSISHAIVGGVNHTLDPDQNILLSKFGGLSSKGSCSTFDAAADGFVRGEGGGIILLKRLEDAERDGDHIFAVIRGSAMNNNGFNENLPATSTAGQKEVLADAYKNSGIAPEEVHYVEAHGTGTKLGDPTECRALGEFFGKHRKAPLHIGSVKTNIGHLEGAAGMAGLIKTILAINKRKLPKNLHFNTPNPNIDFENLKLKVQDELTDWPAPFTESLKAGVNSFGWGGTNAHTVIEEYTPKACSISLEKYDHAKYLLPLSARSEQAFFKNIENTLHYLRTQVNGVSYQFKNICKLAGTKRQHFEYRTTFSAANKDEMIEQMSSFLTSNKQWSAAIPTSEKDKMVFVFPGQGSQWLGMGKQLFETEPVFAKTILACNEEWNKYTDWSLVDQLFATEDNTRLAEIDVIQPLLSAVQIGLGKLWLSLGLMPDAVVGHSMGEVAAAYISGAISLNEAAQIICTRSKLMKTVSGKGGAMAVTELTVEQAEKLIVQYPSVSIAVNNSPKSTVIAGNELAIEEIIEVLDNEGKFAKRVKVDVASHSSQMDPLKTALKDSLTIQPTNSQITLYSTVKNQQLAGTELTEEYWADNLRESVKFASVMEQLIQDGYKTFIEVSPHPVLITSMQECLEANQQKGIITYSLYRDKPELDEIYNNLTNLFENGGYIRWDKLYKNVNSYHTLLPNYAFDRANYSLTERILIDKNKNGHPWIGREIKLANLPEIHFWEAHININQFPFLKDHQVNNVIVLPGASYVEMLLAALTEFSGSNHCEIVNLEFKNTVTFQNNESVKIQLKIHDEDNGLSSFKFYHESQDQWILTAQGQYHIKDEVRSYNLEKFKSVAGEIIEGATYYENLQKIGLQYGPLFQGISQIIIDNENIKTTVKVDSRLAGMIKKYHFHPAIMDSCFQAIFANSSQNNNDDYRTTYLTKIGNIEVFNDIPSNSELQVNVKIHPQNSEDQHSEIVADLFIYDQNGNALLKADKVCGKILTISDFHQEDSEWFYQINWLKTELIKKQSTPAKKNCLIITDAYTTAHQLANKLIKNGHSVDIICSKIDHHVISGVKAHRVSFADPEHLKSSILQLNMHDKDDVIFFFNKELRHEKFQVKTESAFHLITALKAINELHLKQYPKLTLVTNGGKPIESSMINVEHAPLIGLGRVIANELPQFETQQIDLSLHANNVEIDALVNLLQNKLAKEPEVAIRNNSTYVARLERTKPDVFKIKNTTFSSEGYYFITGYNGIAFRLVEWIYEKGARNFVLASRSGKVDEYVKEKIDSLSSRGAVFDIITCDVSEYFSLKSIFETKFKKNNLKGIIHAAGLINASPLVELDSAEYSNILAPKVTGGWNLHLLSQNYDLDIFLLFSSASSMIGLSGQASYVAANAFLDSLAQYRAMLGQTAIAVNWGVMNDTGMVANAQDMAKYAEAEGFIPTSMQEAVNALEHIIFQKPTNIGIFKIKPEQTAEFFPALGASNYFSNLLKKQEQNGNGQNLLQTLELLPDKEEKLLALENHLKQLTSQIIKTTADKLSADMRFKSLGIDSIMAVQLRNKLEKDLSLKLSVTNIWEYPTIAEYADFLLNRVMPKEESGTVISNPKESIPKGIIIPKKAPEAKFRVICIHDAGGSASLFHGWESLLAEELELIIVELPGRGKQLSQKPFNDIQIAVNKIMLDLQGYLNKPYIIFGHSMGGLIAFELMRLLRNKKLNLPQQLFVSSTPQLAVYEKEYLNPRQDTDQLMLSFPHLKPENTPDPELRKVLINLLRNDLHLIDSFSYQFEPPFDLPITAIHGVQDNTVTHAQIQNWKNETTKTFKLIQRKGGHHYLHYDSEFVTHLINSEVSQFIKILSNR
ncbi:type I polyketide synthase [Fulvivirga sediminis]|uniref:Alpha/beta fold hydrolase n=1 Tax=Fulvivirga sediminis TaxID=2803949 RepID=A0A937JYA4_9BACT|nr:type I polyketide synthase [Fulvivirga sediminis]MBL3656243.1 alpha/beta fold hydrolase [Fulvivirga sediminis]